MLRFTHVVFGVSSSPFLLNATIKYHIQSYQTRDPQFVTKFEQSIYVDDVTSGANNDEGAFQCYEKAKIRLAEGGFNLHRFTTNFSELQGRPQSYPVSYRSVGEDRCESYVKNTLGEKRPNYGLKVLGIQWQCTSDQLVIDLSHIHELATREEPTKQRIISFAASFYDRWGSCFLSLFSSRYCSKSSV